MEITDDHGFDPSQSQREDFDRDESDGSSIATENSLSDTGERPKAGQNILYNKANDFAIKAINSASDQLQTPSNKTIVVGPPSINPGFDPNLPSTSQSLPFIPDVQNSTKTTTNIIDSSDVTIGNKTIITGPLTIKQYINEIQTVEPETTDIILSEVKPDTTLDCKDLPLMQKTCIIIAAFSVIALVWGIGYILMFDLNPYISNDDE